MKRKILFGMSIVIALIVFVIGYFVFNSIFPRAEGIEYPAYENLVYVSVSCNNRDEIQINREDFEKFILNIHSAKPTRRQSVNDYPGINPFYTIEMKTTEKTYRYFLYEEGAFYIEIPYQGVYYSTAEFYGMVSQLFMQ